MKKIKSKKTAYVIIVSAIIICLILYYCLNYYYRLPNECKNIPHVIGSLGAITAFCVKRKFDSEQSNNSNQIDR